MKKGAINIIIPLICGYLSGRFGDKYLLLFGNIMITLGWIIVLLGVSGTNYKYYLIGTTVSFFASAILDELSCII